MAYIRRNGGSVRLSALQQRILWMPCSIKRAIRDGAINGAGFHSGPNGRRKVLTVFLRRIARRRRMRLLQFPARAAKQREVLRYMLERGEAGSSCRSLIEQSAKSSQRLGLWRIKASLPCGTLEHNARSLCWTVSSSERVALPLTESAGYIVKLYRRWIRAIPAFFYCMA